jgi:hypothetical protein
MDREQTARESAHKSANTGRQGFSLHFKLVLPTPTTLGVAKQIFSKNIFSLVSEEQYKATLYLKRLAFVQVSGLEHKSDCSQLKRPSQQPEITLQNSPTPKD